MATAEQFQELMNQISTLRAEMLVVKTENEIVVKMRAAGGDKKGLIDNRVGENGNA